MEEMENTVSFYRGGEGGRRSGEAGGRALLRRADRSSSVAAVIETAAARVIKTRAGIERFTGIGPGSW